MSEPYICCKNVSKEFSPGLPVLSDVNLSIAQGAIFGIIGSSGAGKSTLMRCLCGLETPTSGSIFMEGKEIKSFDRWVWRNLRKEIGFVFQHFNLFSSRTALENIIFPLEVHQYSKKDAYERGKELLALVGMEHKGHAYSWQLSGGEKQRIGIARALALHPKILLCDEATSALDSTTARSILALIQELNRAFSVTVVMITHQVEAVKQICSDVAVMEKGTVVEQGPLMQLCTAPRHELTRALLQRPPPLSSLAQFQSSSCAIIVQLCFSGDNARRPLISEVIKNFAVQINIIGGGLEEICNNILGNLFIQICGEPEEIRSVLNFLNEESVRYEVIHG